MNDIKKICVKIHNILTTSNAPLKEKQDQISNLLGDLLLIKLNFNYLEKIVLKISNHLTKKEEIFLLYILDNPDNPISYIDDKIKIQFLNKIFAIIDNNSDDVYFKQALLSLKSITYLFSNDQLNILYFDCITRILLQENESKSFIHEIKQLLNQETEIELN